MTPEQEPKELSEWMTTWRSARGEELSLLREDFARKRLDRLAADFGAILLLVPVSVVLFAKAVLSPGIVTIAGAAFFVPYSLLHAWAAFRRIRARRAALPLSGPEYLSAMGHNLAIEERALRWEQRTLPLALTCGTAVIAWILVTAWARISSGYIAFLLAILVGGFGFAAWWSYAHKPRKLAIERRVLDAMRAELG